MSLPAYLPTSPPTTRRARRRTPYLPERQAYFRALTHDPYRAASGVELNPGALTPGELRDAPWRVLEPYLEDRLEEFAAAVFRY